MAYFFDRRPGVVMGIIVSDAAAERKSVVHKAGKTFPCHQFKHPRWCPIFILFSRREGRFEPHFPAIEALVANLNRMGRLRFFEPVHGYPERGA